MKRSLTNSHQGSKFLEQLIPGLNNCSCSAKKQKQKKKKNKPPLASGSRHHLRTSILVLLQKEAAGPDGTWFNFLSGSEYEWCIEDGIYKNPKSALARSRVDITLSKKSGSSFCISSKVIASCSSAYKDNTDDAMSIDIDSYNRSDLTQVTCYMKCLLFLIFHIFPRIFSSFKIPSV